jgi:hypothetical protein
MSILIEQFMEHAYAISGVRLTDRRIEIWRLLDEYESVIRHSCVNGRVHRELVSFLVAAEARMFEEVAANSRDGVPNAIAGFYREVAAQCSLRCSEIGPLEQAATLDGV